MHSMQNHALTIEHPALEAVVNTGVEVQYAAAMDGADGWCLTVTIGTVCRTLAAMRSGQPRSFKRLETLVAYARSLGADQVTVRLSSQSRVQ
jgi:hypothetical protein